MDAWELWLIAAVIAAVGEILTTSFFLAPFAAGAAVAAILAAAGAGGVAQGIGFVLVTGAIFGVVRPIDKRHLYQPPHLRTGPAAVVGRSAVVLEEIDNVSNHGSVRLDGEVWTARAYDEDLVIEPG